MPALTLIFATDRQDYGTVEQELLDNADLAERTCTNLVHGIEILKAFTFEAGTVSQGKDLVPDLLLAADEWVSGPRLRSRYFLRDAIVAVMASVQARALQAAERAAGEVAWREGFATKEAASVALRTAVQQVNAAHTREF